MARIGRVFETFQQVSEMPIDETDDFFLMLEQVEKVSDKLVEVNTLLDKAFGDGITKIAFMGSSSLLMYNDFFEQLAVEMEKAGAMVEIKVKQIRKEKLVNDHKKTDTL